MTDTELPCFFFVFFFHFLDAYVYLNNPPPEFLPKAAVITVSGLAGAVLARKGKVALFSLLAVRYGARNSSSGQNALLKHWQSLWDLNKSFLVNEGTLLIAVTSWLRADRAGLDKLMIQFFSFFKILETLRWDYLSFRISFSPAFNCCNYLVCISFLSNYSKYLALYRF